MTDLRENPFLPAAPDDAPAVRLAVGLASPLWAMIGGAALAGVGWWWTRQWMAGLADFETHEALALVHEAAPEPPSPDAQPIASNDTTPPPTATMLPPSQAGAD